MSSPLSNSPGNNTINTEPVFQNWAPLNGTSNFTYFMTGGGVVVPQTVEIKIKDVIGLSTTSQYTHFRYNIRKYYLSGSFASWFGTSSPDFNFDFLQYTPIVANGLSGTVTFNINNVNLLVPGTYKAGLDFLVYGRKASGSWELFDSYVYNVKLAVYATNSVVYSPSVINMVHFQDTASPVVPITVNGPVWKLTAPDKYILSSADPAVTITHQSVGTEMIYKAVGTGQRIVDLSLSDFFNTDAAIGSPNLNTAISVDSNSTLIGTIGVNVTLQNQGQFEVSPTSLSFNGTKGIFEPEEQFVFVHCTSVYTIQSPPWLTITPDVFGPGNMPGIKAVPISTESMEGGIYTGEIILDAVIAGIPSQIRVPVTYVLLGYVDIPYTKEGFNFTLDGTFIQLNTLNTGTYFDFYMKGMFYDFYTNIEKEILVPLKIPLLKGAQKFNIGEGIHRLMRKVDKLQEDSIQQYRLAKVGFEIKEKTLGTEEIIREVTTDLLYDFVAGNKPKMIGDYALLVSNENMTRVTASGYQYLNILMPLGSATLAIFKNKEEHSRRVIASSENLYCEKIVFADLNSKPGDLIECRLIVDNSYLSKSFIVFPEGLEKNVIIWEDLFLLKSLLEFTGKFELKSDFENITQNLFKNLEEILVKIQSKKISKLTINTGFISESDIVSIEDLMLSKKAWLKLANGDLLYIVPIAKTLVENDSDRDLISFDIEFQINRKYNEKIYSF